MWVECPLRNFLLLFVVVVVSVLIVVRNRLSGIDWYVVIPLGTIICLPEVGAGVGGSYFAEFPLCNFIIFFVVVVVALIVVGNCLSGRDGLVVIPLGNIICFPEVGAGVG